jgi:dephospho-CoA kinase
MKKFRILDFRIIVELFLAEKAKMTKIIGITGGIAMGKSTVSAHIRQKGFEVIDADKIVHELQAKGGKLYKILVEEFGEEILIPETGEINRKTLSEIAFKKPESLKRIVEIQHEAIELEIISRLNKARNSKAEFAFFDCALLFENEYEKLCDEVWTVFCSKEKQIERLKARNNLTEEEALLRIESQIDPIIRNFRSKKVIPNHDSKEELIKKIDELLSKL